MDKINTREPLLTTAAVSKWLGVSTRTVCLWAECKEIPAIKIGRQWRFFEKELGARVRKTKTRNIKAAAALGGFPPQRPPPPRAHTMARPLWPHRNALM